MEHGGPRGLRGPSTPALESDEESAEQTPRLELGRLHLRPTLDSYPGWGASSELHFPIWKRRISVTVSYFARRIRRSVRGRAGMSAADGAAHQRLTCGKALAS